MRFFDLVSLIVDNLSRRKGRVLLTAVGVVIGTAAVVLLVSLGFGLQRSTTSNFGNIGDLKSIHVYPGQGSENMMYAGGGGGGGGSVAQPEMKMLTTAALEEFSTIPGVTRVIPRDDLMTGAVIRFGRLEAYGQISGFGVEDLSELDYHAASGVTRLERGSVVVGGWIAKNFMDPKLRPGQATPEPPALQDQTILLELTKYTNDGQEVKKSVRLRVVGVLAEARAEQDNIVFMRMDDLLPLNEWARGTRINRNKDGYSQCIVRAEDTQKVTAIAKDISDRGYMAYAEQTFVQSINNYFTIIQIIFGGIGAISLLVAAIGIANTMTMAILERTREIGLMKAIGATNRDVLSIFLGEAAGIGFLGGLGGVSFGWLGGKALNLVLLSYMSSQQTNGGMGMIPSTMLYTPVWLPLFALLFSTLVGLLSGLYPALRAATLVPINALKYE